MAMGRRKVERQEELFVAPAELAKSPGHPFYRKLNELLAKAVFDRWVEQRCRRYYEQDENRVAFLDQAIESISALGEVQSAGAANHLPVSRSG